MSIETAINGNCVPVAKQAEPKPEQALKMRCSNYDKCEFDGMCRHRTEHDKIGGFCDLPCAGCGEHEQAKCIPISPAPPVSSDPSTKTIDDITKERGSKYGPAEKHFATTQAMFSVWLSRRKDAIKHGSPITSYEPQFRHSAFMLAEKLARAANDPTYIDNWVDGQGYSKLAEGFARKAKKRSNRK